MTRQETSLTAKFISVLLAVLLLAGTLTGLLLSSMSARAHLQERQATLSVAAKMLALHLEEYMDRLMQELLMLEDLLVSLPQFEREDALRSFAVHRPEIQALVFLGEAGEIYNFGTWLGYVVFDDYHHDREDFIIRPATVTEETPVLIISRTAPTGQLMAQVNLRELSIQQKLIKIWLGESGHPYLLDINGTVISHRHERFIGQPIYKILRMEDGSPGDIDLFTGASFKLLNYTLEGTKRLAGVVPLPRFGVIAGFSQDLDEIYLPVRRLQRLLLSAATMLTVLVLLLAAFFGRVAMSSLSLFLEQLELIRKGNIFSIAGAGYPREFDLARCAVNKLVLKLHEMSLAAVSSLILFLEARDPITRGHSDRVAKIACAVAAEMGYCGKDLQILARASLLHDVGKVAVPDYILLKPDKLQREEREIINKHPGIAVKILMPLIFLREETRIIEQHHERYDGTGYPRGLKGEETEPLARILAVADAYEAMTSDRPYRKAMSVSEAIDELLKCRGSQFDPHAVDALVGLKQRGMRFNKIKESEEVTVYEFGQEAGA